MRSYPQSLVDRERKILEGGRAVLTHLSTPSVARPRAMVDARGSSQLPSDPRADQMLEPDPFDLDPFDLDIRVAEAGDGIRGLLFTTDGGCGATCPNSCVSSR
jgi:FxLD family lantipeptide